jgi:hypothetical protein
MSGEESIDIAMLKVAPTMAILVERHIAVEYAKKGIVPLPDPNNYKPLEIDATMTLPIVLSPIPEKTGRYSEHDPIEMEGVYKGFVEYVRVMDGWPVFGGLMAEESLMLYALRIEGAYFCAYADRKMESDQ